MPTAASETPPATAPRPDASFAAAPTPPSGQSRSRTPSPYLISAALLLWGLHTGLWWLGALLAPLAELPRLMDWQFELEIKERQRVADLCTVLIVLAGAYLYLNQPRLGTALILLIQWLPALTFPLLAVQLYGRHDGLELSVLFLSLRGGRSGGTETVDLRWPYLLLCVIAASMIPPETPWFYPSLALLAAWALWPRQPTPDRRRRLAPIAALALAGLLGAAIAAGLRWSHDELELVALRWIEQWMGTSVDPYRATTAIGEVGSLKGSERIRLRVYPDRPIAAALLLRTASYDRYLDQTWFTSGSPFAPVPVKDGGRLIVEGAAATGRTRILLNLERPDGLLPLPPGSARIDGIGRVEIQRNDFGTVRYLIHGHVPLLGYRVSAVAGLPLAPPDATDLRVTGPERDALARVAGELGLADLKPAEVLRRVDRFFLDGFRYTLELPRTPVGQSPVAYFVLQGRAGHCEYFATAAALLLREAGIPARYARGWSVQEYSPLEQAWIARDSHAHAWVLAWIDGAWRNFDPTPPDWSALEAADRPWTLGLGDLIAWLRFQLAGAGDETRSDRTWLLLPLTLLSLILAWRIARRARRGSQHRRHATTRAASSTGPFAAIERAAQLRGLGRRPGETLRDWAQRLTDDQDGSGQELLSAVDLHYRSSFDPIGLDGEREARLRALLADCLRRWAR
jgi:hypothetical protein